MLIPRYSQATFHNYLYIYITVTGMYLLGSETRLQITQTKTDSTGTIIITTDLPFITAESRITARPTPFLVNTGNLINRGATHRLREMDVGDENG